MWKPTKKKETLNSTITKSICSLKIHYTCPLRSWWCPFHHQNVTSFTSNFILSSTAQYTRDYNYVETYSIFLIIFIIFIFSSASPSTHGFKAPATETSATTPMKHLKEERQVRLNPYSSYRIINPSGWKNKLTSTPAFLRLAILVQLFWVIIIFFISHHFFLPILHRTK